MSTPTYTKLGDGEVTIEYKLQSEEDIAYIATAPKNVGDYVVRISVAETDTHLSGYQTKEFSITKAKVAIPSADRTSFTYNGNDQIYNIAESDLYTVSGNVTKNAGNYTVKVSLKDKVNYEWADGTVDDLAYNFIINKAKVVKPNADTSKFTYNGENQTYNITLNNAYTVSGNVAKDAGTHPVTVSLKDAANYEWIDGTTDNLTYNFVIGEAPASNSCIIHWFALSILIIGLLLVTFLGFVFKKYLPGIIISILCLIAGIVLFVVGTCPLCTGLGASNIIVFAVITIAMIILLFKNNKGDTLDGDSDESNEIS